MGNGKTKPALGVEYYGESLNSWHRIYMIGRWQMDILIVYVQFTSYIVVSLSSKFRFTQLKDTFFSDDKLFFEKIE